MCDFLREDAVQAKPNESLDELMDGKGRGKRCEKKLATMPDAGRWLLRKSTYASLSGSALIYSYEHGLRLLTAK
jgi:hypothetical protein